jgi:hypothetical protein
MASLNSSSIPLFLFFVLLFHVSANSIIEDGYTVKTVINGHKVNINPHSVLPLSGSSDFVVLDSVNSSFYTISSPISQGSVVKKVTGNGFGYLDGDLDRAKFDKPRSFAVDHSGNIYVADRTNQVIRKISKSGVSTIAQGYTVSREGEPEKNAKFSKDFDVTFVPEICALLVTDHMSWFIHQIDLKPDDCVRGSPPRSVFAPVLFWILGLGVACSIGFVSGFMIRPYMTHRELSSIKAWTQPPSLNFSTWKHLLTNLSKQIPTFCFGIRSVIASSGIFPLLRSLFWMSLSQLLLMCKINIVESRIPRKDFVPVRDLGSCEIKKSKVYTDPLMDLISFDAIPEVCDITNEVFKQGDGDGNNLSDSDGRLESMIKANVMEFAVVSRETALINGLGSGAVMRRRK